MLEKDENHLLQLAVAQIPAYRDFLAKNHFRASNKSNISIIDLPIIDKKNYILKYSLKNRLLPGAQISAIHASSGTTGEPTYWCRDQNQEMVGAKIHYHIFKEIFELDPNVRTLVVISFALGVWVAGNYTIAACSAMKGLGFNVEILAPGMEIGDVQNALRHLASNYEQIVLIGYPSFVKKILDDVYFIIEDRQKFRVLTAGGDFSEVWRDEVSTIIKANKDQYVISLYGCADVGIIGYETPITIALRKRFQKDKNFAIKIFGESLILPSIFEFGLTSLYLEEINNEIIISASGPAPLIRYNIHDKGRILGSQTCPELADFIFQNLNHKSGQREFIFLTGRTDVAVTLFALNVYPEHITTAILDGRIADLIDGDVFATNGLNFFQEEALLLFFKLHVGVEKKSGLEEIIARVFADNLLALSSEFHKLALSLNEINLVKVIIVPNNVDNVRPDKVPGMLLKKSGKPKLFS